MQTIHSSNHLSLKYEFNTALQHSAIPHSTILTTAIKKNHLIYNTIMSYSNFSLSRVKREFNLTTVENGSFFPEIKSIEPSFYLKEALNEGLPLAISEA